jgi:hypothetical protein
MTVSVPVDPSKAVNALERRYREWLATDAGGNAFPLFRRFALEMLVARRPFGVKALAERVRWEAATAWAVDPWDFKLNNDFTAYIARDLIREFPAMKDLIEVRRVREEDA